MIIDTSVIVAVLKQESDAEELLRALANSPRSVISAGNYLELGIVLDSARDPALSRELDRFLAAANIEVVPVSPRQASIARDAYRDFGRGSGHKAKLNFGDCFAYALAIDADEPLLFKGEDFVHTDVKRALG
ncbi:type II toxin-antitoxin system VapC family toxin [Haematomicrobium sanguinis]|uniref:type II toxin-antitoxin system VapC family toxin n=1 Tax=Haematomicrobium sanguinis TaxID=479106 RepID=UPI000479B386|nr:type II toxin-antitoxin system VapC family toxin [Haematomicrobium sanguinis]